MFKTTLAFLKKIQKINEISFHGKVKILKR